MKHHVTDFALFGGPKEFADAVPVGRPNTGDRTRLYARLDQALDSGRLTTGGPLVREFEQRVAEMAGTRHCIATTNGTAALEVMIRAAGLEGEIIMPAMTYVATAHAARYLGLTPVFCDLMPPTGCIDPHLVEDLITARTTAIVGVHLWGQPCEVAQLAKIAHAHSLTLFFDAAHATGCAHGDVPIGGFGLAEMFSFHATKVVTSFEGGAIVTNDDAFARRARMMHNFGWVDGVPTATEFAGTNAKMTEAAAAMGLTSLEALPDSVAANQANYHRYIAALADLPGLSIHRYDEHNRNSCQYLVALVDEETHGVPRDALVDLLRAENVLAQRYFSPCVHELEPYRTECQVQLPATDIMSARILNLPTGPRTTPDQIARICDLIGLAVKHGPEVAARWRERRG
jgi:dTDP-4-amino-4,6-dideoxyglucose